MLWKIEYSFGILSAIDICWWLWQSIENTAAVENPHRLRQHQRSTIPMQMPNRTVTKPVQDIRLLAARCAPSLLSRPRPFVLLGLGGKAPRCSRRCESNDDSAQTFKCRKLEHASFTPPTVAFACTRPFRGNLTHQIFIVAVFRQHSNPRLELAAQVTSS
jgi:hypothetical protein